VSYPVACRIIVARATFLKQKYNGKIAYITFIFTSTTFGHILVDYNTFLKRMTFTL